MELSVIIPTTGQRPQLAACLRSLAAQDLDRQRFEVLVGVDGGQQGEAAALQDHFNSDMTGTVMQLPKAGPAATRNALIEHARGTLLLLLNDDVVADPSLLRVHLEQHAAIGRDAMVLGSAPWAVQQPDRLLDRLVRETSIVFFYDQMDDADHDRDWGFRHVWTLNLSVPAHCVRAVGGFCESLRLPVYEDVELGWRLQAEGLPLRYRPEAVVTHVHRYEPIELLQRSIVLGHQAWCLADASPCCAKAIFGHDVRSEDAVSYSQSFLDHEAGAAARQARTFLALSEVPATAVSDEHSRLLMQAMFDQSVLLRRYLWRLGHLAAAQGREPETAASWLQAVLCEA